MKKLLIIPLLFFLLGQSRNPNPELTLGRRESPTVDKGIIFGGDESSLLYNHNNDRKLDFSGHWFEVGSGGASTDYQFTFDTGQSNPPAIKYDHALGVILLRESAGGDFNQIGTTEGQTTPIPSEYNTEAHRRFIGDMNYTAVEQDSWGHTYNPPNYRPYTFFRLSSGFWQEDQTTTLTNYFEDI